MNTHDVEINPLELSFAAACKLNDSSKSFNFLEFSGKMEPHNIQFVGELKFKGKDCKEK